MGHLRSYRLDEAEQATMLRHLGLGIGRLPREDCQLPGLEKGSGLQAVRAVVVGQTVGAKAVAPPPRGGRVRAVGPGRGGAGSSSKD
jgi:hypothetical protein